VKEIKLFETRDAAPSNLETRMVPVADLEVRAATEDKKPGLRGYAAVFNSESEDFGGWREVIDPGAFKADLDAKADVRALVNHDTGRVLGRTKSGTLTLREDKKGLFMEVDLPDTQEARDLMVSVERGDVDQMSFGFRSRNAIWEEKEEYDVRHLKDVELLEVSVVAFPAYAATEVGKRSHIEFLNTQKNLTSRGGKVAIKRRKLALKTKKLNKGESK
jgi:HK97 family phage prohead protease